MSINWHDLIRFHHSPCEAHKKPNVWAGNGMGSPAPDEQPYGLFYTEQEPTQRKLLGCWAHVKKIAKPHLNTPLFPTFFLHMSV